MCVSVCVCVCLCLCLYLYLYVGAYTMFTHCETYCMRKINLRNTYSVLWIDTFWNLCSACQLWSWQLGAFRRGLELSCVRQLLNNAQGTMGFLFIQQWQYPILCIERYCRCTCNYIYRLTCLITSIVFSHMHYVAIVVEENIHSCLTNLASMAFRYRQISWCSS